MKDFYDYVLQENTFDCGIAALKTIFLQLGKKIKKEDIIKGKLNQGITAKTLIDASKKLGVNARGVKSSLDTFDFNYLPCIAHTIIDKNYYHYIVILKHNKKKKSLLVMDPSIGIKEISYEDFNEITTNIFLVFDKENIKKDQDKRFKKLLHEIFLCNKKILSKTTLLSIFIIILSLISNYFLTFLLKYNFNYKNIVIISFSFLFIFVLKNLTQYYRDKVIIKISAKIDKNINHKVINHIISLPYKYYLNNPLGEIAYLINDVENVKNVVIKLFVLLLVDVVLLMAILFFVSFYSIYYLLIFLLLFIISFFVSFKFGNLYNNYYLKLKKGKIVFQSLILETLNSFNSIKNLNMEDALIQKINDKHLNSLDSYCNYETIYNKYNFLNSNIIEVFYVLIIFVFSIISLNSNIKIFDIVFISNVFYLFINFLNSVSESLISYKLSKTSITKVLDVLEEKKEEVSLEELKFETISFSNVVFYYESNKILDNVNFDINKKDKILLYGNSGSGKSTLIKLLLKYEQLCEGNIYFDNINSKYFNSKNIRNSICYISQDETLFNDTIYNNLSLVNKNENEINEVMKICQINIDKNYVLEENGLNISGGERKKILIARGLLSKRKMIIFDESFNEIDQEGERVILENIIQNYPDLTILLISHRKSNLDLFNKVYELKSKNLKRRNISERVE